MKIKIYLISKIKINEYNQAIKHEGIIINYKNCKM